MKIIGVSCILYCSYTSGYFLIYDDKHGRVHYDDDGRHHHHYHVSHDTRGFPDQ